MTTREAHPGVQPYVTSVLLVRDDETGWCHVAYDIDPRRRPRLAGFVQIQTERALVNGLSTLGFQLAATYRVDDALTAFLFGRVRTSAKPPPVLTASLTTDDAGRR
jgi:hypothetical protein